jgi:hypothetical protein
MIDDASFPVTVPGDAAATAPQDADPAPRGADAAEIPEPVYTAVEDWVTEYFLPMFRRTLGGDFRWCAQWWQHGEAISRLSSLWHAWEALRLQPGTGIATWYRDHLDHQLPILMGARGPFYQCSETAHREPRQAAVVPAPGEWWDTDDLGDPAPAAPVVAQALPHAAGSLPSGHDDMAGLGGDDA